MRNISLAEVLTAALDARMEGVHVSIPGRVVKYYPVSQTADVAPTVKTPVTDDETEIQHIALPTFPNVPVAWPSGGGYFVAFGLVAGDPVQLVFSDTATGDYLETGEDSSPADTRRHSAGYPSCIPGACRPVTKQFKDAPTEGVIIGKDDTDKQIKITGTEIALGKAATDFVALASLVQTALDAIRTQFNAHVHPETGGTTLVPSIALDPLGPVAATIVKAK